MDEQQARALGERFLRPARPRLAAAREVVAQCATAAEAWERLATRDVIPAAWLAPDAAPHAGFACLACDGSGEWRAYDGLRHDPADSAPCDVCAGRGVVAHAQPPNLAAALALAADPAGVATAEALARECAARFARWGHPQRAPWLVVWRSQSPVDARGRSHAPYRWSRFERADPTDTSAGHAALTAADQTRGAAAPLGAFSSHFVAVSVAAAAFARAAAGDEARLAASKTRLVARTSRDLPTEHDYALRAAEWDVHYGAMHARLRAAGVAPFGERPDPYEPLLGIWSLGYGVERLAPGYAVLYAPAP